MQLIRTLCRGATVPVSQAYLENRRPTQLTLLSDLLTLRYECTADRQLPSMPVITVLFWQRL